jgi:glyoxylase-like metal-dependent hydrolase (beta-lactamase superfamily II)
MPYIMEPQHLSGEVELIDVQGWKSPRTTGVLLIQGSDTAVVETGHTSCGLRILSELKKRNIPRDTVRYVFVTHRHGDHCGGTTPLLGGLPEAVVAGHKYALATLRNPERLNAGARQLFGPFAEDIIPLPSTVATEELKGGEVIDLGQGVEIEVVTTPGHTSDHLAYFERKSMTLYTGDAAGLLGPERYTVLPTAFPPSFKYKIYRASLEKLRAYDPEFLAFSHFGVATGPEVATTFDRALESLDQWYDTIVGAWHGESPKTSVLKAVRERFLHEIEVFPHESRSAIIQVLAVGFANSLFPDKVRE